MRDDGGCRAEAAPARDRLSEVLGASGADQKYQLSRRILNHAQNFVLAPPFVDSWTSTKRHTVLDFFTRTILTSDLEFDDPDLTLLE